MISYLKDEAFVKRSALFLCFSMMLITVLTFIINYSFTQKLYSDHLRASKELIGVLAKKYPDDETDIVNAFLRKSSKSSYAYGDKVLKKYGYDAQVNPFNDEFFKGETSYIFISGAFTLILTLIIILYVFLKSNLYIIKNLYAVSNNINAVMEGNFSVELSNLEEGILSKINTQFYQMSRRLSSSIDSIKAEKENIKSLVTDISHQLKTPVSAIKLYNSILLEDDIKKEEREEFLQTTGNEIEKLEWLLSSLLKLSKLEAGMIELNTKICPLSQTIYEVADSFKCRFSGKEAEIIAQIDEEYWVMQDERWTKEAIANIIENAIKYSKPDGKIKIIIKAIDLNSFIRIDISDNGMGIPKKDFNNIFKRFFRGDSDIVKKAEGSGVGLYLTRKILESQGGSISVDSVINEGTTFSLFLQNCKHNCK